MNEITKHAAVARLRKAMELEKLATTHAASCLGLNPCYLSMALNEKSWVKMPAYAWDRLICWCNSGLTLKSFKIPEGVQVYKAKESIKELKERLKKQSEESIEKKEAEPEPLIRVKPGVLETRKKELEASEVKPEIKEPIPIIPKYELKESPEFNPVKNGEYVDPVDLLKDIASRLPANVKIVITINNLE